jgi:hypothetical protein
MQNNYYSAPITERKILHLLRFYPQFYIFYTFKILQFYNFQASLNHKANACSCSCFEPGKFFFRSPALKNIVMSCNRYFNRPDFYGTIPGNAQFFVGVAFQKRNFPRKESFVGRKKTGTFSIVTDPDRDRDFFSTEKNHLSK